jgi:cell division protein FtsA
VELAADIFKMPVRMGLPIRFANLGGLVDEYRDPGYATAIGLVLEGEKREHEEFAEHIPVVKTPLSTGRDSQNPMKKFKDWVKNGLF